MAYGAIMMILIIVGVIIGGGWRWHDNKVDEANKQKQEQVLKEKAR